jgi:hypothetical protein
MELTKMLELTELVLIADLVFTANLELLVSNLLFLDDYFDY